MKIIYSDEKINLVGKSIFLAGPTLRKEKGIISWIRKILRINRTSWRVDAVNYLKKNNFDGTVLIPERSDGFIKVDYYDQVEWEFFGLENCDKIVFWIPRNLKTLPGFTTNVEFGHYLAKSANKVIYGRPDNASKIAYLDWLYGKYKKTPCNTLEATLDLALKEI